MEADLQRAVERARIELAERWPVVVDSTTWTVNDGAVVVDGGVLIASQAKLYADVLRDELDHAVPRPTVLSSLDSPWTAHRWADVATAEALDLHRLPEGDDLQTQQVPPAAVRWFIERGKRALVQLADGTLGWAAAAALRHIDPPADPWADVRRTRPNETLRPTRPGGLAALAAAARARLGRPYRWGGNTPERADCSGLVQGVLLTATGLLLPKHTGDQRRHGVRVAAADIAPGDLVFVRGRERALGHVGVALAAADGVTVVHSCLTRSLVLEEPLTVFLDRYRFTGARRPVTWATVAETSP